ncbi:Laminin G domain protein [Sedimentisphaera cyanobacteriorum]|uniref:Laminin G domain protein n=1 Tax=Sedimentisphaera cyanobacteriorum TaxID=1940790 RepID=A0A1Q2HLL0_9BACT|nr:LamG-like jellyroll fold domain-containing protein [Sedimentisphaera cyanobacteriorum]AQQ08302.1 Laminin G domain protein [Sedimentisphaera cyanobacteriorum]
MNRLNLILMILLTLAVSTESSAAVNHRYTFNDNADDVVGGLTSTLVGDASVSGGELLLDGTDDWLEMDAAGIAANTYSELTMEMWYTPTAGGNTGFTILSYLGGNNPDSTWMGINYFFMTSAREDNVSRAAICTNNTADPWATETGVNGTEYDDAVEHHMAASIDADKIYFYLDGDLVGTAELSEDNNLSDVSNELAYLGKGGYLNDPEWYGSINEFRIYDKVLNPNEVTYTNLIGPESLAGIVIRSSVPEYGADLVPLDQTLTWTTEASVAVDHYNVYFGSDPNIADSTISDVSSYDQLGSSAGKNLTSAEYTPASDITIENSTDYYWRIDTVAADSTVYQGTGRMYTTVPASPVLSDVSPQYQLTASGGTEDAVFSVTELSDVEGVNYQWYKVGDTEDVMLSDDAVYSGTATDTLTITGATPDEEGYYYCTAENYAGSDTSEDAPGRLVTRRLVHHYPLETINIDGETRTSPDAAGGADMSIVSEANDSDDGLDFPVTDPNVVNANIGQYSVFFNNSDAEDPNNAYGQYATLPEGIANYEDITISAWVYRNGGSEWQRIFGFGNDTSTYMYMTPDSGGDPGFRFVINDGTSEVVMETSTWVTSGQWHHVAVTLGGDTGRLFLNGEQIAMNESMTPNPNSFNPSNNLIGDSQWEADPYYNGLMDDFRIYSYALTPTEIAQLYTDIKTDEYICVPDENNPISYDVNGDCRVDLTDMVEIMSAWLDCGRVSEEACSWSY